MTSEQQAKTPVTTEDIPLADDADDVIVTGGRTPRPANPLPREEPPEDPEEKARLIAQVLELQNTLDDLSQRVDSVKEESAKLRSENQVLGQYIQNLMASSAVFQSAQLPVNSNNCTVTPREHAESMKEHEMFGNFFW